ncbi:MAG: ATP synthase F0 subunit B [Desulfuromonadales bacterium]|nr:ATP synthase F0 subunit B [Desulfuromonadales bacterium]
MIEINGTIIVQFVNFVVLMVALNFILYKPLRSMLQKRKETIDGSHQRAKDLAVQVEEKMAAYQEKLQEAKMTAGKEKATMKEEAVAKETEILSAARQSATATLESMKEKVAGEAEEARKALRSDAENLASDIAAKLLGRSL